jgi:hypothetical protein
VALLRWLPPDAACWAGQQPSWTLERELAAAQVELTHTVTRLLAALGGAKRIPRPLTIPRPTDPAAAAGPRGRPFNPDRFSAWLAGITPKG